MNWVMSTSDLRTSSYQRTQGTIRDLELIPLKLRIEDTIWDISHQSESLTSSRCFHRWMPHESLRPGDCAFVEISGNQEGMEIVGYWVGQVGIIHFYFVCLIPVYMDIVCINPVVDITRGYWGWYRFAFAAPKSARRARSARTIWWPNSRQGPVDMGPFAGGDSLSRVCLFGVFY